MKLNYNYTFLDRFLRYVQIDTQSDPNSKEYPSTAKQKILGAMLVEELRQMGVADAHMDEYGYVYATIPSNSPKKVPVICFCSHMDTSPDCSGAGVKPIIHRNYDGGDIVLPDDPQIILNTKNHTDLAEQIGNDIITASGTTLLGADNKAGIAEIMDAANYFMTHPEVKHGTIKILFTPDEEIGRGVDKVNLEKLGADFGYTVDGEKAGSIEDETFSADAAVIEIGGVSAHPGFAKGKMVSALKIASEIVAHLPKDRLSPETTEGRDGFVHPVSIEGSVEKAVIVFIIRSFVDETLVEYESLLRQIMEDVVARYPGATSKMTVKEQYRNMKKILDEHPQVVQFALEAIERAGMTPKKSCIRGGTDGSRLSYMGLPCPNIFAGEHAFHSKQEWISIQDMEKATQTIIHLARIWEEKS